MARASHSTTAISSAAVPVKKHSVTGFNTTEIGGLAAMVYWDGKKYKWEPTDFADDSKELKLK